ncbi:MAG: hypothetical protein IID44_27500 [Planctomycetes bacterium]|nr:hypothetical protein [Planctomycetota bacterium]
MRRHLTIMVVSSLAILMAEAKDLQGDETDMSPKTAADARRVFHERAKAIGLFKGRPKEWWSRLKDSGKQWHVRRQPYSVALKRVVDTLREDEKDAIVYGTLDDLRKKGDCWHIEDLRGSKMSVIAYLDSKSGKLVFLWQPPEG